MVKTVVRQAVPLQPMEVDGGADIHLQPMEDPMPEQVEAPEGGCDPMGSPRCSRLLAGPVDPWREEPMLEQTDPPLAKAEPKPICDHERASGITYLRSSYTTATAARERSEKM
ncbi:AN1-type zinc finger protein 5-like [Grus japonensis]|uniref:AN1-type zinc finger protein 5-like n=1 Tax=Grus japonensis TaxID=30415 RepID=A0ABC9WUG7_GRUJA